MVAVRSLVDAEVNGATRWSEFVKNVTQTTTAGVWYDLTGASGNPRAKQWFDAAPLTAAAITQSGDGGIFHGSAVSTATKYLRFFRAACASATPLPMMLVLCDYLLYYPTIEDGNTDPQTMTNSVTLPRYTDGKGVQMMAVTISSRTGGQSFQVTYTNSDGVAGRVSPVVVQFKKSWADEHRNVKPEEAGKLQAEIAKLADRRHVAVHRVDRLERHDLGGGGIGRLQQLLEMAEIVVAEDLARGTRVADAGDHRGVVIGVGIDLAARQHRAQRLQGGLVGHVARGEDQSRFLAMQVGELRLQIDMIMGVAADVTRAARTGADVVERFLHRGDDLRMLPHRQIVVGAPDGDRLGSVMPGKTPSIGEHALVAQDVDEDAVTSLGVQAVDRLGEDAGIIHARVRALDAHGAGM